MANRGLVVPITEHSTSRLDPHVVKTMNRPVKEREAASDYVRSVEHLADEWGEGPLWRGHALHRAFLAGVDWARREQGS